MAAKHFVLIGNYVPDDQESMLRFTGLLAEGLAARGINVEILSPRPILGGRKKGMATGLVKWLRYVDKWIFFRWKLRAIVRKKRRQFGDRIRYHVCDHSNAPYLAILPKNQTAITCHDVLAIRGALGYSSAYCPASHSGLILQKWILANLRSASRIACVSKLTLEQLCEITKKKVPEKNWQVVHNALNAKFQPFETSKAHQLLKAQGITMPQLFLLHVGSNLQRKNRRMLLQMVRSLGPRWQGNVCFAGEPADNDLLKEAEATGISSRIFSVSKPSHEALCALYSLAHAFIFPSFSEGFGWPLIEAQACGAPVIASNFEPLPEISGGAAIHEDPNDAEALARALLTLENPDVREKLVVAGSKNSARFTLDMMVDGYLQLHDCQEPIEHV